MPQRRFKVSRWSDNDKFWGPFTYSKDTRDYRPFAITLSSADDDDRVCNLRLSAFGHTLILALPDVIKPTKVWVSTSHYDWAKSPDSGYWQVDKREYGISYNEKYLSVRYGRSTMDSDTDKTWGWFIPWLQWRYIGIRYYDDKGDYFGDVMQPTIKLGEEARRKHWNYEISIKERCPQICFGFTDYDGTEVVALTRIEEREYQLGEGSFKWLSWFRQPKFYRALNIDYSVEVGRRKGSWKGGTIGTSILMLENELHLHAFKRHMQLNNFHNLVEAPK